MLPLIQWKQMYKTTIVSKTQRCHETPHRLHTSPKYRSIRYKKGSNRRVQSVNACDASTSTDMTWLEWRFEVVVVLSAAGHFRCVVCGRSSEHCWLSACHRSIQLIQLNQQPNRVIAHWLKVRWKQPCFNAQNIAISGTGGELVWPVWSFMTP